MSKGLEHLEILENLVELYGHFSFDFTVIEQELKALEIIKNKRVDITLIQDSGDLEYYNIDVQNYYVVYEDMYLTQEEYKLLKEVLL